MKNLPFLILGLIGTVLVPSAALADNIYFTDNFSGTSVNPAYWQTILPLSTSSVVEGGGVVTTTGRGVLATANQYTAPYQITGDFTMLTSDEHFNISLRTGLTTDGTDSFFEEQGLIVSFAQDGQEVSIQEYTSPTDWNQIALANYSFQVGQEYSFGIIDTGTSISLSVDGVDLLSANSSFSDGSNIAFYSREFPNTATAIDDISIKAVPDSGLGLGTVAATLLGICGLGSLKLYRKNHEFQQ